MFGGASKKCGKCNKSIYHNDPQLALGGKSYHKSCARCATCNGYLSIKNFSTSGDRLLCKTHFKEEFSQTGGVYAGDDKFKQSGSRVVSRCNSIESSGSAGAAAAEETTTTRSVEIETFSKSDECEAVEVSEADQELSERLADAALEEEKKMDESMGQGVTVEG
jgi:cysteine and glycine-rich protein